MKVSPDTEGFREELHAKLEEATAGTGARAKVSLDTAELDSAAEKARAKVDELGAATARPRVRLEDGEAASKIGEIRERLAALSASDPSPRVKADVSDAQAKVESIEARIDRLNAAIARPAVTPQMASAQAQIDALTAKLEELGQKDETPKVKADTEQAQVRLDIVRARLDEIQGRDAQVRVKASADLTRANADLDRLLVKLDELNAKEAKARLALGDEEFNAKLDKADARLREFNSKSARPSLGASGGGHGGGEGGGFLGGHGMMAGIVGGITSLLPGIGGAAMGAGLLGGAGALGLGGVGKALQDAHQAALNLGRTPEQTAATQFSNQVAQQNAGEQVTSARLQQAQDAITAARSIESAQLNLASVERNSAAQQVQAIQSVRQAEQGLQQANYSLSEAQYNLNQAWERARENLRELDDQLADSKLNVQQAQLAIKEALYQQKLVEENAYSTSIDREQAALNVAQAQQRLVDAQDHLTASQYKANLANEEGIDGSQEIIKAKQALVAAQYGQADAQAHYAIAQQDLTRTELNNATQVHEARARLAAAEQDAAYQRQMDARSVALAERHVGEVVEEQQLQWAAMKSTENEAARQLQADLARMTPAMRGVVEQILGMNGAFEDMKRSAQNAIAPGLSQFFTGLSQSMPVLTAGMSAMGGVIGQAFGRIGEALQSKGGQDVLQGLIDNGLKLAQTVGPALGGMASALAQLGSQKGAADGLAGAVSGIAGGIGAAAQALGPFVGPLGQVLSTLGQALTPIGTLLGQTVGQLAQALAPALQALLPAVGQLTSALGAQLGAALQAAAPGLAAIVTAFVNLLPAVTPLIGIFGALLAGALRDVSGILQGLSMFIADNVTWLRPVAEIVLGVVAALKLWSIAQAALNLVMEANPIGLVAIAIAALLGGVVYAYHHFAWFREGVQATFHAIGDAAEWLWHDVFVPVWHGIETGAKWLYENAILPLWHGIESAFHGIESAAGWLLRNVFEPLWHGISAGAEGFINGFKATWDKLMDIFKNPVGFMVNVVYTKGIEALWNGVVHALGQDSLKLPDITGFSGGGIVPGRDGGVDTVPAMLRPEEGILVPEAVAAIGGPSAVYSLNATYGGGRASSDGYHFSGGGIAGIASSVGDFVGGLIDKAVDIGKITAAVATGNGDALTNALSKLVGTRGAAGNYAQMMLGIPTTLIHSMVKTVTDLFSTHGGGGTIPTGQHLAIIDAALAAAGVPPPGTRDEWRAGLNTLIGRESGWDARAINLTDCVTLDAMILTRRGWLKHDEVQVGDETIGFDPVTQVSRWTPITQVVHYEQAPVVHLGNSRWHATVTPNHRWVSAPREHVLKDALTSCPECGWEPGGNGGVAIHRAKAHGVRGAAQANTTGPVRMVETQHLKSRDRLILAAPAETGDGLPITTVEAEILGWLAGDGHIEEGRRGASMSIAQSKPRGVKRLQELLAHSEIAVYTDERLTRTGKQAIGPRHIFRFRPEYRRDLLGRVGHPKHDAVSIVMRMSREQRDAWLNGFIDAEGHRDGGYVSVSQVYGPVLDAAHLAIYLCGYRPRLVDNKITEPGWSPSAHISACRPVVSGAFLRQEDAGQQDVWCVTTELGTWTCEQDGQIFLTGNSNAKAGDPSRGLAQTIMSTFLANHVAGTSNDIYDPVANVAAAIRYIVGTYGGISRVQQANPNMPPKGYDVGGVASGVGLLPKYTPLPERVLSPRQTESFDRLVAVLDRWTNGMPPSSARREVTVVQNYNGTQVPTPEQQADMRRQLALALSGG